MDNETQVKSYLFSGSDLPDGPLPTQNSTCDIKTLVSNNSAVTIDPRTGLEKTPKGTSNDCCCIKFIGYGQFPQVSLPSFVIEYSGLHGEFIGNAVEGNAYSTTVTLTHNGRIILHTSSTFVPIFVSLNTPKGICSQIQNFRYIDPQLAGNLGTIDYEIKLHYIDIYGWPRVCSTATGSFQYTGFAEQKN